jgi:hypothetical protein
VSRLFISLYLDEDVSVLVARLIRSRAFYALSALDAEQLGRNDAEQLGFAAQQGMAILTHNRADFEELARQYAAAGRSHSGIIIAVRRTPYELARRLLVLLNQVTADEMDNLVLYI